MSLAPISVELSTAALLVLVLIVDCLTPRDKRPVWRLYQAGTAALLALALLLRGEGALFGGAYIADGLSWFAKALILLGALLAGALSSNSLRIREKYHGAYAALLLAASLGMMVLVSSKELITLYVGLETSAVSLYGLAALARDDELSLEAGIKYVILGALSSGILLYGLSLVYTITGTTYLQLIRAQMQTQGPSLLFGLALVLILLGVGFKLSMVPMHVWTPDVYQGAPTPVSAFLSVVSKSAGFIFLIRLFFGAFLDFRPLWGPFLVVIAVATMTVGNLAAIPQKNVKRFLAYSTISQAGYILTGFVGAPVAGESAVLFYLLVYTFTNMAAFTVVIAFSSITRSDRLEDYAGLARREPLLALAFTLALLSLAGIPPLGGFVGKIYLFYAAMKQGYLWLVIVGGLNSIISLYYYLLVLKRMYIEDGAAAAFPKIALPLPVKAVLVVTTVGMLGLGLASGPVMRVVDAIFQRLFLQL